MSAATHSLLVHATTISAQVRGQWRGVMLMGPSGAGKSDLGLRLMNHGFRLVADDYSRLFLSQGHIYATAPQSIQGMMEIRESGLKPL